MPKAKTAENALIPENSGLNCEIGIATFGNPQKKSPFLAIIKYRIFILNLPLISSIIKACKLKLLNDNLFLKGFI